MGYRDDREALRQQVDELRGELEALRATSGDHGSAAERVETLTREVNAAIERMEKDREVLRSLASSLAALRISLGGSTPKPETVTRSTTSATPSLIGPAKTGSLTWIFAGAVMLGVAALVLASRGRETPTPLVDHSPLADIPGAPKVDPLALLPSAERMAPPNSTLTGVDAWYVAEDGTIDLGAKAYTARVSFHFQGPTPPEPPVDPSLPLGAPRPLTLNAPSSCFELDRQGIRSSCSGSFMGRGTIPKPTCSTRAVWEAARAAGAPSGAVAHLTYEHPIFGRRASWKFRIEQTSQEYEIADPGCRVLTPSERLRP